MAITEVFGGKYFNCKYNTCSSSVFIQHTISTEFRTGKTQLSLTLCGKLKIVDLSILTFWLLIVTTQLPGSNGYCGGKVVFIDTEVCFFANFCIFPSLQLIYANEQTKEHFVSYSHACMIYTYNFINLCYA